MNLFIYLFVILIVGCSSYDSNHMNTSPKKKEQKVIFEQNNETLPDSTVYFHKCPSFVLETNTQIKSCH